MIESDGFAPHHAADERPSAAFASEPAYQDDLVTLWQGAAEDVLPGLDDEFDLVFTSPPYNMGISTGGSFPRGRSYGKNGKGTHSYIAARLRAAGCEACYRTVDGVVTTFGRYPDA